VGKSRGSDLPQPEVLIQDEYNYVTVI
jgi:hypothetical protein